MAVKSDIPPVLSEEYAADPYAVYRLLQDHHPVYYDESIDAWLVSRLADIRTVFRHPEVNSDNYEWQFEEVHGRTILQMYGREHAAHRRLLNPFLSGAGLDRLEPVMHTLAEETLVPAIRRASAVASQQELDSIQGRAPSDAGPGQAAHVCFDLVSEFSRRFPIAVTREVLGIPHEHHDTVQRWYMAMAGNIQNLGGDEGPVERGIRTRREIEAYFLPIIRERREGSGNDLISLLARADVQGKPLSDDEIRSYISLILIAGGETTDANLANLFTLLIEHPDQFQAVYENRSLVHDAIAEQLRFHPSNHMIMRVSAVDLELSGAIIPAGSTVACMLAAGNRDPRKFERPDEFDIFRADNDTARAFRGSADHVAFGDGRHFCAGAMFAREAMTTATNLILDRMASPPRFPAGFTPVFVGIWVRQPVEVLLEFEMTTAATAEAVVAEQI